MIAALLARNLEPVQQPRIIGAAAQSHADHEHMIELQSLGAVNGHQRHSVRLRGIFSVQALHEAIEIELTATQALAVFFIERREEPPCMCKLARVRASRGATERQPGTLDEVRSRFALAIAPAREQQGLGTQQSFDTVDRQAWDVTQQRRDDGSVAGGFADRSQVRQ